MSGKPGCLSGWNFGFFIRRTWYSRRWHDKTWEPCVLLIIQILNESLVAGIWKPGWNVRICIRRTWYSRRWHAKTLEPALLMVHQILIEALGAHICLSDCMLIFCVSVMLVEVALQSGFQLCSFYFIFLSKLYAQISGEPGNFTVWHLRFCMRITRVLRMLHVTGCVL